MAVSVPGMPQVKGIWRFSISVPWHWQAPKQPLDGCSNHGE
jgi:hypothetical protein